jgi:hypothetical protein
MQRDWPSIHATIDRPLEAWSVRSLHAAFLQHGCAIVRGGVGIDKLAEIENLATRIYARKPGLHIADADFREATGNRLSLWELVDHPFLKQFREALFQGQNFSGSSNATCRRIQGAEQDRDWQRPLDLHVDSHYHPFAFTLNHWIPFQDAGERVAGIQVLPVDYRTTRTFTGFTGQPLRPKARHNFHFFPQDFQSLDAIEQSFGVGCMLRPRINAGDIVLLSNWIIHGTFRTETMTRGRMNAELRFIGEATDID